MNISAVVILSEDEDSLSKYSMMRISLWIISLVGIALNLRVFQKYRSAKQLHHSKNIRNSIQLVCCMATADNLSLLALMLALSTRHLGIHHEHKTILALMCKMDLFVIHSASAFSIWCWLILSAIRYLAVFKPFEHLRLKREPLLIILFTAFICCLLESWIWFDVTYIDDAGICGQTLPEHVSKFLQVVEILWTYFLPLTLITVLDIKVLFCYSTSKDLCRIRTLYGHGAEREVPLVVIVDKNCNSMNLEKKIYHNRSCHSQNHLKWTHGCWKEMRKITILKNRRRARQLRILKRCLCISIIDLGMNLPNYLIRLYIMLIPDDMLENTFFWVQDLSQLLYFAQFSLNTLYLVGIIYVLPRNSSTKTIKSHRQREKENQKNFQI